MSFLDNIDDFDEVKNAKDLLSDLQSVVDDVDFENDLKDDGYQEVPDGYYYSEVQKATFGLNKAKDALQVMIDFQVVQNGVVQSLVNGANTRREIPKTVGRHIYKYYTFKGDAEKKKKAICNFAKDMTCFEDENGAIFLPTDFQHVEAYDQLLPTLDGMRIFIKVEKAKNSDFVNKNLISWTVAKTLHLDD